MFAEHEQACHRLHAARGGGATCVAFYPRPACNTNGLQTRYHSARDSPSGVGERSHDRHHPPLARRSCATVPEAPSVLEGVPGVRESVAAFAEIVVGLDSS